MACSSSSSKDLIESDAGDRVCVPGSTQSCLGPGRCEGAQRCDVGGLGFGECTCDGSGGMAGAAGTSGGSAGAGNISGGPEMGGSGGNGAGGASGNAGSGGTSGSGGGGTSGSGGGGTSGSGGGGTSGSGGGASGNAGSGGTSGSGGGGTSGSGGGGGHCLDNIPMSCPNCVTQNPSEQARCLQFLDCYRTYDCDPATACGQSSGVCGVNVIGGPSSARDASVVTYQCACN